ncbi:hypothetical protein L226DRAFT_280113 [Lentinus tigrinus ALCF2SS1-7]|nr:hypothetical protein L226DRAFT_280113 [Lentinus tigrinus ALCF2SS1-7]
MGCPTHRTTERSDSGFCAYKRRPPRTCERARGVLESTRRHNEPPVTSRPAHLLARGYRGASGGRKL